MMRITTSFLLMATFIAPSLNANQLSDKAIADATPESVTLPTDEEIQRKIDEKMPEIRAALSVEPRKSNQVPDVKGDGTDLSHINPPQSVPKNPVRDIMQLAENLNKRPQTDPFSLMSQETEEVILFVSTSMPDGILRELLEQAAYYKVTVAFRGTPAGDLNYLALQQQIINLGIKSYPNVEINPVHFTKYAVDKVPTFAVGKYGNAPGFDENGCLPATKFAKISGDISIPYALNELARRAPIELRPIARRYMK